MIHFPLFLYHILYYARWFCFNGLHKCVTILWEFVFGMLATLAPSQNWTINDPLGPMLRTSHFLATYLNVNIWYLNAHLIQELVWVYCLFIFMLEIPPKHVGSYTINPPNMSISKRCEYSCSYQMSKLKIL
jgi:hypothetical protein